MGGGVELVELKRVGMGDMGVLLVMVMMMWISLLIHAKGIGLIMRMKKHVFFMLQKVSCD